MEPIGPLKNLKLHGITNFQGIIVFYGSENLNYGNSPSLVKISKMVHKFALGIPKDSFIASTKAIIFLVNFLKKTCFEINDFFRNKGTKSSAFQKFAFTGWGKIANSSILCRRDLKKILFLFSARKKYLS